MDKKKIRVYVDTSVIGGCYDEEFELYSNLLIEEFCRGKKIIITSEILMNELGNAPDHVKNILLKIPVNYSEHVLLTDEVESLAYLYRSRGIVPEKSEADSLHIALATIYKADVLVSWNFKHIVNFERIHLINAVNLEYNYSQIDIRSPQEVLSYYEE